MQLQVEKGKYKHKQTSDPHTSTNLKKWVAMLREGFLIWTKS